MWVNKNKIICKYLSRKGKKQFKMLSIKNLHVSIEGREIIKGLNLEVKAGEVHAIMGPNGTGKSTLAAVVAGREGIYEITKGEITYKGKRLDDLSVEERAREGIFLGFQYPVEIPGVTIVNFMRTAINEIRNYKGQEPIGAAEFLKMMEEAKNLVGIHSKLTNRSVNEGFSGGEKRKMRFFKWPCLNLTLPFSTKPIRDWTLMH